jgi:hypothetical protein
LDPEDFLKKHKHSHSNWKDYLEFEERIKAPQGKYRLVSLGRETYIPFSLDQVIGDFETAEAAEEKANSIALRKTTVYAIYTDQGILVKSVERKKWEK